MKHTTSSTHGPERMLQLVGAGLAAAALTLGVATVTAPLAGAKTKAQTVCSQMGGSYKSTQNHGDRVETCEVDRGSGPVLWSWVNDQWQGATSHDDGGPQAPGHVQVPISNPRPQ